MKAVKRMSNSSRPPKEKISSYQGVMVSFAITIGTLFITMTREIGSISGEEAYIAVPVAYLISALLLVPVFIFNSRFPGKRIGEYSQTILGRFFGKLLSLMLMLVMVAVAALILRNIAEFWGAALMPETPPWFFLITMVILVVYTLIKGFEVYARVCQILFLIVIGSLLFLVIASLLRMDTENLLPVFYRGWEPLLRGCVRMVGFAAQYAIFSGVLCGHLRDARTSTATGLRGWLGAGLLISLIMLAVQGVFGPQQVAKFVSPPLELAKIIEIGGVARGLEALIVSSWIIAGFLQVSAYFYTASILLVDTFPRLQFAKALLGVSVPILAGAYVIQDQEQLFALFPIMRMYLILPAALGAFGILIAVAFLRGLLRKSPSSGRKIGEEEEEGTG
jgi:spore germination protein KB